MVKQGKVWGVTKLIEGNASFEMHRLEIAQGGICSKHLHEHKWNGFFLERGLIKIRVWQNDYDLVDETILRPDDYTKVKPGLYHQFEALEKSIMFETYWVEFDVEDIVRETVGKKK